MPDSRKCLIDAAFWELEVLSVSFRMKLATPISRLCCLASLARLNGYKPWRGPVDAFMFSDDNEERLTDYGVPSQTDNPTCILHHILSVVYRCGPKSIKPRRRPRQEFHPVRLFRRK
jgi:hypothetical protein